MGCVAYVRIAPERRASKIEPPRVKACFIGYVEHGWMFWRPNTNTVFVSDDANFDESSFELHRGNSDDSLSTSSGSWHRRSSDGSYCCRRALAPGGDSRNYTPPPVGRARSPDREYTPAAPGRERAPGDGGRVQHSNGQELAPIVPNGQAPAPVVPNGRAPAPVAGDADNNTPDPNQIPDGYEPVVPTTERTSELAERWGAPAGSRRRGWAEQQAMFVDVEWEQVLNVVVNLEECNGWTNLSSIVQGSTEGISGIEELEAYQVWTGSPDEPTYKQAMAGEDREDATDPPPGVQAIPTKVVLIRKRNDKGDIIKYKARIVARGDLQNHHGQTFSPTARIASIRMINVIAHVKGYRRLQFDVNSAYLHGRITEPLWIKLPDGSTHRLCKIPRMEEDFGVYRRARSSGGVDRTTLLAIYVDDGLLACDDDLEGFLSEFDQQFKLKRGEVELFLGMKIATDDASGIGS
ncbi:BQ5605_C007g04433 [Microbotryum silenes-dioicae]|uniref:BQ5605_C007g04433 protein n=1 Tax=Microbotryum silenes-dioicae TaxID=796604 RepID=A0A2X0P974_9BASI|nr:BQ5605_C007g04433 [Microbotryum silenes-dioicae]